MPWAQFEEKQYETAANVEFAKFRARQIKHLHGVGRPGFWAKAKLKPSAGRCDPRSHSR